MKGIVAVLGILMVSLTAGFAQTAENVEKALRYRAGENNTAVVVKSETTELNAETPEVSVENVFLQQRSAAQLEELGGFSWNQCECFD